MLEINGIQIAETGELIMFIGYDYMSFFKIEFLYQQIFYIAAFATTS